MTEDNYEHIKMKKPKCTTCGDSGKKSEIPPDKIYINYLGGTYAGKWQGEKGQQGCNTEYVKVPCPDCTQVEDIMDFVEPEEYLKPDEQGYCPECSKYETCDNGYKEESGTCDDWQKPNEDRIRGKIDKAYWEYVRTLCDECDDPSKEKECKENAYCWVSEDTRHLFRAGYKSALSDHEKEIEELKALLDKAVEGLEMIEHWKDAYPENVFPPLGKVQYKLLCDSGNVSVDRVSAHVLRQGVKGYSESATTLLKEIQEGRK